jgi:hypothetical protein
MFVLLQRYADKTGGIVTRDALGDLLREQKPGVAQMYGEAYDALTAFMPDKPQFLHSVGQLRELAAGRLTGDALAMGMLIMREGSRLDDGTELLGHADARSYVLGAFADAERAAGAQDSPEGEVDADGDVVLRSYALAKQLRLAGQVPGVMFGLPSLDAHLAGGLGNGELALVAAWTTAGKSSFCVQVAWYNAVKCGKNVIIFTTEQLRRSLVVKIIARHSMDPKFGLRRGLDTAAIRAGRLSDDEEKILAWVTDDLKGGGYGHLNIVQMPEMCTISVMASRAAAIARQTPPDLCIADYLQLFAPDKAKRDSRDHEDQSGVLKQAQRWATTFRNGQGVPLISPWQTSKEGRRSLKTSGGYSLEDLSATSEAGKTPGMVLALADREDDTTGGRAAPLELTVLKNRDGPRGRRFSLTADFATCHFADRDDSAEEYDGLEV